MVITNLVFLGPAGSGKSTLTANFGAWLNEYMGFRVRYVNLDPGADYTPYKPDYDIREFITVEDVMREEKLGPNGAILRCMDLMLGSIDKILKDLLNLKGDFRLIDTPGQMEAFVLRRTGPELVNRLTRAENAIAVFLLDLELVSSLEDLITAELLGLIVQLKLMVPMVMVLNKSDILEDQEMSELLSDPSYLREELEKGIAKGLLSDVVSSLSELLTYFSQSARIVKISAKNRLGFEALYDLIHEAFCVCGDLT